MPPSSPPPPPASCVPTSGLWALVPLPSLAWSRSLFLPIPSRGVLPFKDQLRLLPREAFSHPVPAPSSQDQRMSSSTFVLTLASSLVCAQTPSQPPMWAVLSFPRECGWPLLTVSPPGQPRCLLVLPHPRAPRPRTPFLSLFRGCDLGHCAGRVWKYMRARVWPSEILVRTLSTATLGLCDLREVP